MKLFDIIGPVMTGPSSSHTAGAVKIGLVSRALLGSTPARAEILLHGSFAQTGRGHGTDRALVAGLLGMRPDDPRIPESFSYAEEAGLSFDFQTGSLKNVHPNTARLTLWDKKGNRLEVVASSLGGGRIQICRVDGIDIGFSGGSNTLIVHNEDKPGCAALVTALLAKFQLNIATIQLCRNFPGGYAVMVIECDQHIPAQLAEQLEKTEGIARYQAEPGRLKVGEEEFHWLLIPSPPSSRSAAKPAFPFGRSFWRRICGKTEAPGRTPCVKCAACGRP